MYHYKLLNVKININVKDSPKIILLERLKKSTQESVKICRTTKEIHCLHF